ncbi:MAG: lipopolysaccharide heptosyltransferase II [Kiritimatiellae bacterium]|nr:lipopolysaccharide heptosyltransferase II [Kiritimatiellia bacterium]
MNHLLICGVNWIGDALMSMPALQTWRERHPAARLELLVKPALLPLWSLHRAPDALHRLPPGTIGVWRAASALRRERPEAACIFPNSFRSALIPWLAGVPRRIGAPGHLRRLLLSEIPAVGPATGPHQAYEYYHLLSETPPEVLPAPLLTLPEPLQAWALQQEATLPGPWMVFLPGAARGPSKQWPEAHWIELGRHMQGANGVGTLLVLGSPGEAALCGRIAEGIGGCAVSLAGQTDIPQWAALMSRSRLVVANDSGGMHLAAAVGTRVLALFGITDPEKTGPLGRRCRVIQKSVTRQRDIPRDCPEARAALAAILPAEVEEQALDMMGIA